MSKIEKARRDDARTGLLRCGGSWPRSTSPVRAMEESGDAAAAQPVPQHESLFDERQIRGVLVFEAETVAFVAEPDHHLRPLGCLRNHLETSVGLRSPADESRGKRTVV